MPAPVANASPSPSLSPSLRLDALPAEAFGLYDAQGQPWPAPRARRREQRRCEGVWLLPVSLADDLRVQAVDSWQASAQAGPAALLVQQGDIWECPLTLDPARPWPAGCLALALMLWPHVNRSNLRVVASPQMAAGLALAAAAAHAPASAAGPPAGPSGAVLAALQAALDGQGRAGGNLASGVIQLAG